MRTRNQIARSVLMLLALAVACASAQTQSPVPTENIITHMEQAAQYNHARFHPYVTTVDYKLFGKDTAVPTSQVIAELAFDPPYLKSYSIQQSNGAHIGETIVRRILEDQKAFTKDSGSTDISQDNYDFRFIREEDAIGYRCYVLELLPRRKAKNLLHGNVWVDANTYLLRRVEGELVKSSSWWLRDLRIILLFGYVGEMWTQISSEDTAEVRMVGRYKMISQDVNYKFN
jgi:negative regulator of sigma E activity